MALGTLARRGLAGLVVLSAAAGGVLPVQHVNAQQRVMVARGFNGGPGGSGQVSKKAIERYAETLGWNADTTDTAKAIHQGYAAAMEDAQKVRRAAMEEMRRVAEDTGDHGVFMEKLPKVESEYRETTTRLEKALFDDLKALLATPEQEAAWLRVERMRRREVGLRDATLSGEGVDLVEVVRALKLPADEQAALAAPLDEYETDMDRALEAKAALKADIDDFRPNADPAERQRAMEKMQKAMAEGKEVSKRIQDVNQRHARRIADALSDTPRAAFEQEMRKRSFPQVYREGSVARDLNGALGLSDLTADQREAITALKAQYERDAALANERWAAAIRESEATAQEGAFATGAGVMRISMGDEPEALKEARKARRELDEKAADRVKSILTPGQREKLPKAPPQRDGEAEGLHVMEAATIVVEEGP